MAGKFGVMEKADERITKKIARKNGIGRMRSNSSEARRNFRAKERLKKHPGPKSGVSARKLRLRKLLSSPSPPIDIILRDLVFSVTV